MVPIAVMILSGMKYPGINDITTDFTTPPEFTHAQQLPQNQNRDLKYDAAKYMARQQSGYPPLAPLHLNDPPAAAFDRVKNLAASMPTWTITSADPATMTIEGVSTSAFSFPGRLRYSGTSGRGRQQSGRDALEVARRGRRLRRQLQTNRRVLQKLGRGLKSNKHQGARKTKTRRHKKAEHGVP